MSVSIDPISRLLVASWPARFLLSSGRYRCWLSASGSGRSQFDQTDLIAWSPERLTDLCGLFIYLRDVPEGNPRSIGRRPCGRTEDRLDVSREPGLVRFLRQEPGLEVRLEICVLTADAGELRRVHLRNTGDRPRTIEITTYGEVALQEAAAHAGHPAFSRLFVRTEAVARLRSLLFQRRPRANSEFHPWMVHALLESAEVSWETDRGCFLGRGGSPRAPRALRQPSVLTGTTGDVLDPACTLRSVVRLEPGGEVQRTFLLGAAPDRPAALDLVARLQSPTGPADAFAEAARREDDLWRGLGLDAGRAAECERLAGALLYGEPAGDDRANRASESGPAMTCSPEALAACGLDPDNPWVLFRVAALAAGETYRTVVRYWRALGLPFSLVVATPEEAWVVSTRDDAKGDGCFRLTPELSRMLAESAALRLNDRAGEAVR